MGERVDHSAQEIGSDAGSADGDDAHGFVGQEAQLRS
jgi:hypothetical protein